MAASNRKSLFSDTSRVHRGKTVSDIASSAQWQSYVENLETVPKKIAVVPAALEGRPDLISNEVYGTPDLWWLINLANHVFDDLEDLKAGVQIVIPQL